jgi:hypothetical protein
MLKFLLDYQLPLIDYNRFPVQELCVNAGNQPQIMCAPYMFDKTQNTGLFFVLASWNNAHIPPGLQESD